MPRLGDYEQLLDDDEVEPTEGQERDDLAMESASDRETLGGSQDKPKAARKPARPTIRKYLDKKEKEPELLQIFNSVLQTVVPLTAEQVLTHMPGIRDLMFKALPQEVAEIVQPTIDNAVRKEAKRKEERKAKRVQISNVRLARKSTPRPTAEQVESIDKENGRMRASARSPIAIIVVNDNDIKALSDTGAEVCVMSEDTANLCGLVINKFAPHGPWTQVTDKLTVADGSQAALAGWVRTRF